MYPVYLIIFCFFYFNAPATTEIYTLSLHDALPISILSSCEGVRSAVRPAGRPEGGPGVDHADHVGRPCSALQSDRKSTRLNSSHVEISYAVFCLKKKNIY